jgi:hypothetical protein
MAQQIVTMALMVSFLQISSVAGPVHHSRLADSVWAQDHRME